jgi:isocitrate lyase
MGGKVLVPTEEHVKRLQAARLQCDIMGTDTLVVARTDAQAANLLDSNIDERDQWQILGVWDGGTCTLSEAVETDLRGAGLAADADKWASKAQLLSHRECRILAADILPPAIQAQMISLDTWNAEKARTQEGYYRTVPSVKACIQRGLAYAPHAGECLSSCTQRKPYSPCSAHAKQLIPLDCFPSLQISFGWKPVSNIMRVVERA